MSITVNYVNHACRVCHAITAIPPSRAKRSDWICHACCNARHNSDDARYLARKLASLLIKRGVHGSHPGTAFVRQVIQRCSGRSVLSGERNVKKLCVVRVDQGKEWALDNAVLVTSQECGALTRLGGQGRVRVLRGAGGQVGQS